MAKYFNKKITINGLVFDSKKEAARWQELNVLEKAGKIINLDRQKVYVLIPAIKINGRTKPALRYVCDFAYFDLEKDEYIVEDVKSAYTQKLPVFRIKQHLMKYIHNIDISCI